jgi:hypothetical protein
MNDPANQPWSDDDVSQSNGRSWFRVTGEGIVVTLLSAGLLSLLASLLIPEATDTPPVDAADPGVGASGSLATTIGISIWTISIAIGVWYVWRRMSKARTSPRD